MPPAYDFKVTYFDWVSATASTNQQQAYDALCAQFASLFDMHQKPMLLLYANQPGQSYKMATRALAQSYPEVDAVVFFPFTAELISSLDTPANSTIH